MECNSLRSVYIGSEAGGGFTGQLASDRGERGGSKIGGRDVVEFGVAAMTFMDLYDVGQEMEEYNAQATAQTFSVPVIKQMMGGLERAELVELMNLPDWPMVADVKGVHPPSLSAPRTLRISSKDCPFLQAGLSNDGCAGSVSVGTVGAFDGVHAVLSHRYFGGQFTLRTL